MAFPFSTGDILVVPGSFNLTLSVLFAITAMVAVSLKES